MADRAITRTQSAGPSDQPDRAELTELKSLWQELRDDILEAQRLYQPDRKPWGCIFD